MPLLPPLSLASPLLLLLIPSWPSSSLSLVLSQFILFTFIMINSTCCYCHHDALAVHVQPAGPLVAKCKSLDQARAVMTFLDAASEKTLRSTVALTAARGRGKVRSCHTTVLLPTIFICSALNVFLLWDLCMYFRTSHGNESLAAQQAFVHMMSTIVAIFLLPPVVSKPLSLPAPSEKRL